MYANHLHNHRQAFTLIELSIVLVIIGLITGGVLVGRDLIHHTKVMSVATDIERYRIAVNLFKDRHRKLPGDMAGFSRIYGCTDCDGNGDSLIADDAGIVFTQLQKAGFLNGEKYTYSKFGASSNSRCYSPISCPAPSKYLLQNIESTYSPATSHYNQVYFFREETMISYGPANDSYSPLTYGLGDNQVNHRSGMYPADAHNLDTKFDDGLPHTGKVRAEGGTHPDYQCVSSHVYHHNSNYYRVNESGELNGCTFMMLH